MDDLAKTVLGILSALITAQIGMIFWSMRKQASKDERKEEQRDYKLQKINDKIIVLESDCKRIKEDWEKHNVDKAYDSAKRCHERLDKLEKEASYDRKKGN